MWEEFVKFIIDQMNEHSVNRESEQTTSKFASFNDSSPIVCVHQAKVVNPPMYDEYGLLLKEAEEYWAVYVNHKPFFITESEQLSSDVFKTFIDGELL